MKWPTLNISSLMDGVRALGGKLKKLPLHALDGVGRLIPKIEKFLPTPQPRTPASSPPDDDGVPDYLKPTFVERHAQKLMLAAAYFLFFALIGGTALYLWSNEEAILQAEKDRRPSLLIEGLRPEIVRLDADGNPVDGPLPGDENTAEARNSEQNDGALEEPLDEPVVTELAPHPDPALIEATDIGPLPIIAADGRRPWRVYNRPHSRLDRRPQIAIVITEMGLSDDDFTRALSLPGPVSFAFAPYARKLTDNIATARSRGHEVLLTLPMEPADFPRSDPGPFALMTSLEAADNVERLNWILSRATGYVGLANFQGGSFLQDKRSVRAIMSALGERGLLYLDTRASPSDDVIRTADIAGTPAASADIIADQEMTRGAILRRLKEAEIVAKTNQTAIIIIRPYPMVMDRIQDWAQGLSDRGIALAPLSAVIQKRDQSS